MSTVFTKVINRELPARIVWEDRDYISFLPIGHFVNIGHLLLVPKLEIDDVFDLPTDLYSGLWRHAKHLSIALKIVTGAKRIGIAVEGFSVPHVHVHLCPVNSVAELDPHRNIPWTEQDRDEFIITFNEIHAGILAQQPDSADALAHVADL